MSKAKIELFEIKNLFDQFDVKLPLTDTVNIFLGENGMGKTTILSCLYNTLSGKIEQLSNVIFSQIIVTFDDGTALTLTKDDVTSYVEQSMGAIRRFRYNIKGFFSEKELIELRDSYAHTGIPSELFNKSVRRMAEMYDIPMRLAEQELARFLDIDFRGTGSPKKAREFKEAITNLVDDEIFYFPTYRRIEEDMSKLGIDLERDSRGNAKDKLIQFGMSDVDKRIKVILDTIKSVAINGFAKMTGVLLKQYLDTESISLAPNTNDHIDEEKLSIALERIGDEIDIKDKQHIKELVHNSKIYDSDNAYLRNLINNLIDSYEQQNLYDERVKKFVSVCNGYLSNKKYVYDESRVELNIYHINSKNSISTQNLSSGEKQVISLFSKLYLDKQTPCIILFDEPELSLSIKWQSTFLPDIIDSGRCNKLMAVTHSPFIFDNALDKYARDMNDCIYNRFEGESK